MKSIPAQADSLGLASSAEVNAKVRRAPVFERMCAWGLAFLNSGEGPLDSAGCMG